MKTLRLSPTSRLRRAFTLIEMIITLAVFLLLTGAVFGLFDATLRSASSLQDDQARADRTEAFQRWLAKNFLGMPAGGVVVSYLREGAPFDVSDVVWSGAGDYRALDLHRQPNGLFTLRLAVVPISAAVAPGASDPALDDFERAVLRDDASLNWRPLLRDLATADWRFRSQMDALWSNFAPGGRQLVVQFSYQIAGNGQMVTSDCWIPPLADQPQLATTIPATVRTNP